MFWRDIPSWSNALCACVTMRASLTWAPHGGNGVGFVKRIARWGAVGGTARWAAKLYQAYIENEDAPQLDGLCATLVMTRYQMEALARPDGSAERTLDAPMEKGCDGAINSVAHLIVLILVAEAGFDDNEPGTQVQFPDAILEELAKAGVPDEYAIGRDLPERSAGRLLDSYLASKLLLQIALGK